MSSPRPRYLVISPVKDEERYVERTLASMVQQTLRPVQWVIVDDGSTDRTPEIIASYAENCDFIRIVRQSHNGGRQPGSGVVRAFNTGYQSIRGIVHDFIVKLDCDLSFEADYFERLLACFDEDGRLGIASGVYFEPRPANHWVEIRMPEYHAAGASKVIRRQCFEEIGGFVISRGWDTVDEIRAMTKGWRTTHFRELKTKHWKIEGSSIGPWRTSLLHGENYYLTGGGSLFFLLKTLDRIIRRPFVIGAVGLVYGYLKTAISGKPRLVTRDEARLYRALLNRRILDNLRSSRGKPSSVRAAPQRSA